MNESAASTQNSKAPGIRAVTLIRGDGVGPEVMNAVQRVVDAAEVKLDWQEAEAGAEVFRRGDATGVPRETVESIQRTRVVLKGPLETPVGYGEKSANVTIRKLFEMYGNVRPCRDLPGVTTPFSGRGIDLVVVRENVEDLYAGIEYMQTPGVAECLKLMSRKGCEKIVRLAFELARSEGRKLVHCATKSNIMKLTEGLLKRTFEEVAQEYPEIQSKHIIIDNLAHQLVIRPEEFDVIVTSNLNGDIISDLTSGLVGGLGLAPSSNLGDGVAMFEAVHGSAPDIAGQDRVNPTAMLLSATLMLRYLGEFRAAGRIENAVMVTLQEGPVTGDIAAGRPAVGTTEFTDAVIQNLGRHAEGFQVREGRPLRVPALPSDPDYVKAKSRRVVGFDLFVESGLGSDAIGRSVTELTEGSGLRLKVVSNRGTVVFPPTEGKIDCVDHFRCRFVPAEDGEVSDEQLFDLTQRIAAQHRWVHIEKLMEFDGELAFTKAQGED